MESFCIVTTTIKDGQLVVKTDFIPVYNELGEPDPRYLNDPQALPSDDKFLLSCK